MTAFFDLGLNKPICQTVADLGYTTPTPIQAQTIPQLLEGRDLLGIAQTGTGKTAAFSLPLLQRLGFPRKKLQSRMVRALILAPTRELVVQIGETIVTYAKGLKLSHALVTGGVGFFGQINSLRRGVDVLVATPGRLLDLMRQHHVDLSQVEVFILDEADRMLDMGFIPDVRKISESLPKERQTMLFSATMPDNVAKLAADLLINPQRIEAAAPATTVERIEQKVLFVESGAKRRLLEELLRTDAVTRAIVFTRTKHGADRVSEHLQKSGLNSDTIHGNKSQGARQKALSRFRDGDVQALVATDIAARGIDIEGVSHVINFDLPVDAESYVHRIGRTARAGARGIALSLCAGEELDHLRAIEKLIGQKVEVDNSHTYHAEEVAIRHSQPKGGRPGGSGKPGGGGSRKRFFNNNSKPAGKKRAHAA